MDVIQDLKERLNASLQLLSKVNKSNDEVCPHNSNNNIDYQIITQILARNKKTFYYYLHAND